MKRWICLLLLVSLFAVPVLARKGEPDVVVVQHILISFKNKVRGKQLDRTKAQARALAEELLQRAQDGEDFMKLIEEYTDDRGATYTLTNTDAALKANSFERRKMAVYFGDVSFSLEVGEVGLAKYHAGNSPYGWHVIKRIE